MAKKKLDPAFKTRWIEALRSEKYQQGYLNLRIEDKFCCLGVALDIDDPSGWIFYEDSTPVVHREGYRYLEKEFGIDYEKFWELNDDQKLSFPEIANYIEANL